MSTSTGGVVPPLFTRMIDDAAVFPPGSAPLPEAVVAHRGHRAAWYADMIGPLLLPATALRELPPLLRSDEHIDVGVIADVPIAQLYALVRGADERIRVRQVEASVAKRGEDPRPGLAELFALPWHEPQSEVYAEIPLTWGLMEALDSLETARATGTRIAPKFRTGGLAAELFPTPVELAAVICACRDRELPFKLTAGLHHAIRHGDPETGFTHHGFLNVLVATMAAVDGAELVDVAAALGGSDPVPLIEELRPRRAYARPLWIGFGSCSVDEPLAELVRLSLIQGSAT